MDTCWLDVVIGNDSKENKPSWHAHASLLPFDCMVLPLDRYTTSISAWHQYIKISAAEPGVASSLIFDSTVQGHHVPAGVHWISGHVFFEMHQLAPVVRCSAPAMGCITRGRPVIHVGLRCACHLLPMQMPIFTKHIKPV